MRTARFHGAIGYGEQVETVPGVVKDVITERSYYGDVLKSARQLQEGENLNKNISVQNSISVVADEYAVTNFLHIRYIRWAGTLWTVSNVEVQSPRLIMRLGEVYNGPTP